MGVCRQFADVIGFKKTELVTCKPRIQKCLIEEAILKFYRKEVDDGTKTKSHKLAGINRCSGVRSIQSRVAMNRDQLSKLASAFMKAMRSNSHNLDVNAVAFVKQEYKALKKRGNMMDFDDYIRFATLIMQSKKVIHRYLLKVCAF